MSNEQPTVGEHIFLKTDSGYLDPTPWEVMKIHAYMIEVISPDGKMTKLFTHKEYRDRQREMLEVTI